MYGELFIKPWELHRMSFKDVTLSIKGLNEAKDYQYDLLYRSTAVIASSGTNAKHAMSVLKKALPIKAKDGVREALIENARKRLKQNQEADDKKKVKKILNG